MKKADSYQIQDRHFHRGLVLLGVSLVAFYIASRIVEVSGMSTFIIGFLIVYFLFWSIKAALARGKSFAEFFIGDQGTYSLSRVQAVVWAFIIISTQVSVIIAIISNPTNGVSITHYELKLAEPILWLLGLSLASYVTVKGITTDQISQGYIRSKRDPNLQDLIKTDGRLDFSRFQMLIWTGIAMLIFLAQSFHYVDGLLKEDTASNMSYYFMDQEERKAAELLPENNNSSGPKTDAIRPQKKPMKIPHLPTISWSFLVLMGLSSGAYVGRKLVPTFRAQQISQNTFNNIQAQKDELAIAIKYKAEHLLLLNPITPAGLEQKEGLELELAQLKHRQKQLAVEAQKLAATFQEDQQILNNNNTNPDTGKV